MKYALIILLSFCLLPAFAQVGSFRKVETTDLRFRTMLNTDITKFLTTDPNGHVVLATVSGGGSGGRFGYPSEDVSSDADRSFESNNHSFSLNNASYIIFSAIDSTYTSYYNFYLSSNVGGIDASDFDGNFTSTLAAGKRGTSDVYTSYLESLNYSTHNSHSIEATADSAFVIHKDGSTINKISFPNNRTGTVALLEDIAGIAPGIGTMAAYKSTRNYLPKFTPKSSKDKRGIVGRVTYDEKYEYIKTASGWKRTPLERF